MGAAVAMAPLIDDEGLAEPVRIDLVGAEQVDHIDLALLRAIEDRVNVPAPFAGHEAEVEAGDAGGGGVQHAEAVPADVGLDRAHGHGCLGGERQDCGAVGPRKRRLADDDQRPLGALDLLEEGMIAAGELGEGLGTGAEMLVRIGEVGLRRRSGRWERGLASAASASGCGN